ncbi:MAG: CRISPR-associated ring nuclease [Aggregatilineales bacterium]
MRHIYLATIGQRPQAVTVAFDDLHLRYNYERIGLLHTDPVHSGIAEALRALRAELGRAYSQLPVDLHEVRNLDGSSLLDIEDESAAEAYFYGVLDALLHYKQSGYSVHLMVAGGRKAMSVYAVYAASLLLDEHDAVWTVLTPQDIMERRVWHVPPHERNRIQVTLMPFLPSRFAPTTLETLTRQDIIEHIKKRLNRRELLLSRLTDAQRRVANVLALHDEYSDAQIAQLLSLSERTVQRHLQDIYNRMRDVFDFGDRIRDQRLALIKIMKGWE